jgi:O-succinylbenzoic acid--CoA ligase
MDCSLYISRSFWNDPADVVLGDGLNPINDLVSIGGSVIFKTSGSMGAPKWVVHEKRAMLVSAEAVNAWLGVNQHSKWGLVLPIEHVGGFAILARVFQADCGLAEFDRKWDAGEFHRWLGAENVTHVSLVPTQVHDLVKAALTAPSHLCAVVVGGGRLNDALGQAARDLGWPVMASYGMTEAGSQIATQAMDDLKKPFCEGSLKILPIWQVKSDAVERLSISGEALFRGYMFQEGNSVRFEPLSGKVFLTQDRGIISQNHLKLLGRMDNLLKVLGVLVDIEAVERRFIEIEAGRVNPEKFAVIALPDPRREHVLVAVFEGDIPISCFEEYQRTAPKLERFSDVMNVEVFPRSSLGKLRRGELAEICGVMRQIRTPKNSCP